VVASGGLAALGGAYLVLVYVKYFTEGISAGKGYIALAALIFGR
jgi:simple sugar transport system permease protein